MRNEKKTSQEVAWILALLEYQSIGKSLDVCYSKNHPTKNVKSSSLVFFIDSKKLEHRVSVESEDP